MPDGIPSPNPDFPQPIKNVTGQANVKIQNKNLFDKTTVAQGRFIRNTDGTLGYSDTLSASDFIPVKANISYYQSNVNNYYSCLYDKNKNFIRQINSNAFIPTVDGYMRTSFLTTNTDIVQIEQGGAATSYVPHQEQNYPFTFAQSQRAMQGTTLEDDGIHHIRRRIEITNENVDTLITLFDDTTYSIPCIKIPKTSLGWKSGWATGVTKINRYSEIIYSQDKRSGAFTTSFQQINLIIFDNRFTDLETAKSLLIGTIIEIEQAEEEIIPYNETQASEYNAIKEAHTYKDITYISGESDELPPLLDIQYWKERGAEQ